MEIFDEIEEPAHPRTVFPVDEKAMMNHSERHKFVAQAAPLILAAQCIDTDITFSSSVAAKNSVELASKLMTRF